MQDEIIYINKIKRTPKCALCPKGCIRDKAVTNLCTEKIGLDVEGIESYEFEVHQSVEEIYNEFRAMEKISQGGKFAIHNHLRKLRAAKREKALSKMIEYLEQKTQLSKKESNEPLQLILIDPDSEKYKNVDLIISSDCAPFINNELQKNIMENQDSAALILFCPKKPYAKEAYTQKLAYIFNNNNIKSVVVIQTETPCCTEMGGIVKDALKRANKIIPRKDFTVTITGEIV